MSLVPGVEDYKEEAVITGRYAGQQAESANRVVIFDAFGFGEYGFYFAAYLVCPFKRSRRWQLHIQQQVAIIFIRKKARRQLLAQDCIQSYERAQNQHCHKPFAYQSVAPTDVAVSRFIEPAIEEFEETAKRPAGLFARLEQHRRKRGRKRQRVK